jgi:23S rRNA (adenine2503-C2)-methyltransferase
MREIKELNLGQLEELLKAWGRPDYQAKQIFSWLYQKKVQDFSAMSDLPLELRSRLKAEFSLQGLSLLKKQVSRDGTEKFLFRLQDKNSIEAVVIPAEKRITGCVSSQVGCRFGCKFCASGMLGFKRNLTCAEILDEVLSLGKFTHIVFMGAGEPLDNYDNVLKAARIINAPEGLNIGARRITISTCGIIPRIKQLAGENLQVELSISLHAADNCLRSRLVPLNKKYPLQELLNCCREYTRKTNRQITFEYVLIKGVNSDLPNAEKLSKILTSQKLFKVNLIPANNIKELRVVPPNKREVIAFRDYLLKSGVNVTLRKPRGEDIQAACGQLRL